MCPCRDSLGIGSEPTSGNAKKLMISMLLGGSMSRPGISLPVDRYAVQSTVLTTLEVGRWLTVGSFDSLASSSSYCGSVATALLGRM